MTDQLHFFPTGLTRKQNQQLTVYTQQAAHLTVSALRQAVEHHLGATTAVQAQNPLVNVRLATAIRDVMAQVLGGWEALPPTAPPWLAAAMLYFAKSDDDEPDFL